MYLSVICFSFSCSWLWGMWGSNNVFFPLSWSLKSGRLLKITSINSQLQCVHSPWVLPGQEGFLYMMSTQFLRSSWGSWTSWSFYSSTLSTTHPSEVVQSCPDSCDPVDCSLPGSSIHRISHGVGCHFLLQEIFLTQGLNPGLPHCRQTLYHLSHQGSPQGRGNNN